MSQRALGRRLRIDKSPMVGLRRRPRARRASPSAGAAIATGACRRSTSRARGRRVLQRVTRLADEGNERTFGALDEDERVVLHDLLLRVAEATPAPADRYSWRSAASAPTTFCSHARSESSRGRRRSRRVDQLDSSWRAPTATSGPTIA